MCTYRVSRKSDEDANDDMESVDDGRSMNEYKALREATIAWNKAFLQPALDAANAL